MFPCPSPMLDFLNVAVLQSPNVNPCSVQKETGPSPKGGEENG